MALVEIQGQLLASRCIEDIAASLAELLEMPGAFGDNADNRIPAEIEATRRLLVAAPGSSGRDVLAVIPLPGPAHHLAQKTDAQEAASLNQHPAVDF